jgi:hypothetical protein
MIHNTPTIYMFLHKFVDPIAWAWIPNLQLGLPDH